MGYFNPWSVIGLVVPSRLLPALLGILFAGHLSAVRLTASLASGNAA
jgi:hypothetical protein